MEKKQNDKVIPMPSASQTPADVAISRCMQNMFATYGEKKVRASLKELFGMKSNEKTKKVA